KCVNVWDCNPERYTFFLPLQVSHTRIRTALIEPVGQEFSEGGILRRCRYTQSVVLRVVLIAPPAQVIGKNPLPGSVFLDVQEERVGAGFQVFAFDLHVIGEGDGGALVSAGAPRRTFRRPKALVKEAVVN